MENLFVLENLRVKSVRKEFFNSKEGLREKHQIKITDSETKSSRFFTYTTEVVNYIDRENLLKNALYCIFMDYDTHLSYDNKDLSYEENLQDFLHAYGYDYKGGKKLFNAINRDAKRFENLFNEYTYEGLQNEYENY